MIIVDTQLMDVRIDIHQSHPQIEYTVACQLCPNLDNRLELVMFTKIKICYSAHNINRHCC